MIKCEIDNKEFKNAGVLARYLQQKYNLSYKKYYHIKNNVSGITLCKECHNNFHPSLNF